LVKACQLNSAMCYLKLDDPRKAEEQASKVLKADSQNVKALYRRAQAYHKLGEFSSASKDLKNLLEVDSGNADARKLFTAIKETIKKEEQAEKGLFARMFK
jgi:FK506-binding protein 4/5